MVPQRPSTAGTPGAAPSPTRRARESQASEAGRATTAGGWERATRLLDRTRCALGQHHPVSKLGPSPSRELHCRASVTCPARLLRTPPTRCWRHHAAPSIGRARSDVAALGRAQLGLPFPLCRARGVYGAPAAAAGTATATAAGCYLYGEEEEEERELRDTSTQVKGKVFL